MSIFDLSISIRAIDKASSTLSRLEKNSGKITANMKKHFRETAETMDRIGKSSLITGGVLAAGFGLASKTAGDFEQQMANVKAVSGATGAEFEKMTNLALKMGSQSAFNSIQAAEGMEAMLRASIPLEKIMSGGLKSSLDLAAASGMSVAEAAETASTALNTFSKEKLSVAKAADILAGADKAGATSIESLQMAISQSGAVATNTGMKFADLAATLALFEKNGLKGSDAGTSLKTMLMNLQPRTKEQISTMRQLGLLTQNGNNLFFDSKGKMKDMSQIAQLLAEKTKNLTDKQKQFALETIFGSDSIRAANVLIKEQAIGLNAVKKEMNGVTVAQMAATKIDTFNGSMSLLNNEIKNAQIAIGEALIPAIKSVALSIKSVVAGFNAMPKPLKSTIAIIGAMSAVGLFVFGGLAIAISQVMNAIVTLGAVSQPLAASIIPKLAQGVLALSRGFLACAAAMWANPITWYVAGAIALVSVGILLYKSWKPFRDLINGIGRGFKSIFGLTPKLSGSLPVAKSAGKIPKFDVGSRRITQTGLAVVHKDEKILPAERKTAGSSIIFNPQIYVSGGNPQDIRKEVEKAFGACMQQWQRQQTRVSYA